MCKLNLITGLSYIGAVKATAEKPFVEINDKALADYLVGTGRFVLVTESAPAKSGEDVTCGTGEDTPLDKMTEKQLEAYATENGIDLAGLTKKADKLAKIKDAESGENKADFGEE